MFAVIFLQESLYSVGSVHVHDDFRIINGSWLLIRKETIDIMLPSTVDSVMIGA